MDYKEEQAQELEILATIYPDELEVESPTSFTVDILLDTQATNRQHSLQLQFTYPETYPDVAPRFRIKDTSEDIVEEEESDEEEEEDTDRKDVQRRLNLHNLVEYTREDMAKLESELESEAEMNIGLPMVFTLCSVAKDLAENLFTERLQQMQDFEAQKVKDKEKEERKKFEGTKVTPETFKAWREKFKKEMGIDKRIQERLNKVHGGKMSGKVIFEKGLAGDEDMQELESGVAAI